jgi:hypothetical protein
VCIPLSHTIPPYVKSTINDYQCHLQIHSLAIVFLVEFGSKEPLPNKTKNLFKKKTLFHHSLNNTLCHQSPIPFTYSFTCYCLLHRTRQTRITTQQKESNQEHESRETGKEELLLLSHAVNLFHTFHVVFSCTVYTTHLLCTVHCIPYPCCTSYVLYDLFLSKLSIYLYIF